MNHTEDDTNWQFRPGSLDADLEDDDLFDYSKLLARESNSEPPRQARADGSKAPAGATADAPRTGRLPPRNRAA